MESTVIANDTADEIEFEGGEDIRRQQFGK